MLPFVIFLVWPTVIGFSVVLSISFLFIVMSQRTWNRLTRHGDLKAIQTAHLTPTPRLGGIAVCLALVLSAWFAFGMTGGLWVWLLICALPLFLSGAAEDLGYRVAPIGRLLAAFVSGALVVAITGLWIDRIGVPGFDRALSFAPIAIFGTVLVSAALAHAFNLIDGLNGLAGFTAVFAACGIAVTAYEVGDTEILTFSSLIAVAVLGFLVFNFPYGRIFFGDAGAYSVGFLLAWLAIALAARHADVSAMAMLLMMFWPLADMLLAVYRRYRRKVPVSHPDRLHFHQLVMRALEIELFGRRKRRITNPLATTVMLPFIAVPVVLGVQLHDQPLLAALVLALCFVLFFVTYAVGMRYATRRTRPGAGSSADLAEVG